MSETCWKQQKTKEREREENVVLKLINEDFAHVDIRKFVCS